MSGNLLTYLSAVPNDDNSGCSLAINLKTNSGNTLGQLFINDSSALINDVIGNAGKNSNNQKFIFGPSGSNELSLITISGGTSTIYSTSYNAYSDYRLKENIKTLDETYTIENIRPVEYTISQSSDSKKHFGVIAHELAEMYPNLVNGEKDCTEKMQTVNYVELIPILIKRIQTLKQRVTELENHLLHVS